MDVGQLMMGSVAWLAVSIALGVFIATATNVAGSFSKGDARTPFDWLIWVGVCSAFFFLVGQALFWSMKFAVYVHQGGMLPGSG